LRSLKKVFQLIIVVVLQGAIELLMSVYKNKFRSAKKYLTDSSKVQKLNILYLTWCSCWIV